MSPTERSTSPAAYQPALDGLRAIAVIAVLLFHGGMKWLPGGFLGVDVFFVLSGYLITGILIRNPSASFRDFYTRRVRRLYPALIAMLLVTVTCAAIVMQDAAAATVRDLPWAFLSLSNWWFVFHRVPYFEAMGRLPLFRHTWSLAVEFQFYLVWPILVRLAFSKFGRTGVRYLALTCAVISVALLALTSLTATDADASRAYFGTDTHSMGLFLGAALATSRLTFTEKRRTISDVLGLLSLATLFALFHFVDDAIAHYRYGLPLASVCSMVLIPVAILPGGTVARWLATAPLNWVGTRSYSIYLWHWPIFQATRPGIDTTPDVALNFLLRLALTAAIAEVSYRLIEMPMRLGVLRYFRQWGAGWTPTFRRFALAGAIAALLAGTVADTRQILHAITAGKAPPSIIPLPPPLPPTPVAVSPAPAVPGALIPNKALLADAEKPAILKAPTMLLGDSVLLGVSQWLTQKVNIVKVDATVGRQATELRKHAEALAKADEPLPPVVIINLGNNGTVDEPTFRAIMDSLRSCKRVIVVNTRVPRKWQDDNDALIAKVVPDYQNAILADWKSTSEGHPEYFGSDGVHANVAGAKAYTDLIISALITQPMPTDIDKSIPPPPPAPEPKASAKADPGGQAQSVAIKSSGPY